MINKKCLIKALDDLPEQITESQLIELLHELHFLEETKTGLQDVREGRVYSLEDAKKLIAQ